MMMSDGCSSSLGTGGWEAGFLPLSIPSPQVKGEEKENLQTMVSPTFS